MPNKEKEPAKALLASDPKYLDINDCQILLATAVNLRIACNSRIYPGGETTINSPLVAGYLKTVDFQDLPETSEELTVIIDGVLELQKELLQSVTTTVKGKQADDSTMKTMALVPVPDSVMAEDGNGVWPTGRSDAEWDALFQQTAFFDEYAWVASLFAKELVFKEFFRESIV